MLKLIPCLFNSLVVSPKGMSPHLTTCEFNGSAPGI